MPAKTCSHVYQQDESAEYWFEEGCFIVEWMNLPAEPAVSVARARVPAATGTHWHRLTGITERYVILSGQGRVHIEGLAPQMVGPGAIAVIAPGQAQRIDTIGSEDLVFMAICTPRFTAAAYQALDDDAIAGLS